MQAIVLPLLVSLTKPRIVVLLLVTTLPAMFLAHEGVPAFGLMAATVIGGSFAAMGANAANMVLDRDIDKIMQRTLHRPLPTGSVSARSATVLAAGLEAAAAAVLVVWVNVLSAALALGAAAFYIVVYTLWLKRRSPSNIVIGGAAGAVPPLVGWAAVENSLSWAPVLLFAIVFFLDAASFLGFGCALSRRLSSRRRAHAACGGKLAQRRQSHSGLHADCGRAESRLRACCRHDSLLLFVRCGAGRSLHCLRHRRSQNAHSRARHEAVLLFHALCGRAFRRNHRRCAANLLACLLSVLKSRCEKICEKIHTINPDISNPAI